jgi:hypothetical protein
VIGARGCRTALDSLSLARHNRHCESEGNDERGPVATVSGPTRGDPSRPRTATPSAAFLSNLARVYASLPTASDANLQFLAKRFAEWRRVTRNFVRTHLAKLVKKTDPLLCPISLFRPKGYGRLETGYTRTLGWLLDPKGEHGFGTTLLAALFGRPFGYGPCSGTLRIEGVESELLIDGSGAQGRLDVLAKGTWEHRKRRGWVLVIEAKVDAWEGEEQLQKYDTWLRSNAAGRDVYRIFLTPDRRPAETGAEEWTVLSYLQLVRIFRAVYGRLRHKHGFHFLRFYLAGVLQDICGWPREVTPKVTDPYAVVSYLKTVHDSPSEGAGHGPDR